MTQLFLVRHANSPFTHTNDHQRPLSELGSKQATQTATFIKTHTATEQVKIVCSDALRTLTTADIIGQHFQHSSLVADHVLYLAQVGNWCDVIQAHQSNTPLILVGHNPTVTQTANYLSPHADYLFKPGCAAHFSLEIAPDGLKLPAQLHDFFVPHAK